MYTALGSSHLKVGRYFDTRLLSKVQKLCSVQFQFLLSMLGISDDFALCLLNSPGIFSSFVHLVSVTSPQNADNEGRVSTKLLKSNNVMN